MYISQITLHFGPYAALELIALILLVPSFVPLVIIPHHPWDTFVIVFNIKTNGIKICHKLSLSLYVCVYVYILVHKIIIFIIFFLVL